MGCRVCEGHSMEDVLEEHRQNIDDSGWSMVGVYGHGVDAPWAYTVGTTRYDGHPELVASAPDLEVAANLLTGVAECVLRGERFAAGDEVDGIVEVPLRMFRVRRPDRLVVAQEIFGTPGHAGLVPALQLVWPDAKGRWPWEVAWRERRPVQELFGSRPTDAVP